MDASEADVALAGFWERYAAAGRGHVRFAVRHPGQLAQAWRAARSLRQVEATIDGSAGGRHLSRVLDQKVLRTVPWRRLGVAVLDVPEHGPDYLLGSSRQTLRRKLRKAEAAGVRVRAVAREERPELLDRADEAERRHPDPRYRVERPDNRDLLDHDLWLVAEDGSGEPLLVVVLPTTDTWATLRYFRTLGWTPVHSDTRYLATAAAVAALSERGVRHLLDTEPPGLQSAGVLHFQRMLGFRLVRVRTRTD